MYYSYDYENDNMPLFALYTFKNTAAVGQHTHYLATIYHYDVWCIYCHTGIPVVFRRAAEFND